MMGFHMSVTIATAVIRQYLDLVGRFDDCDESTHQQVAADV